ncbi:MAG: GntR family transcriptional regulator [Candidatus Omnitrophota bacterium]
MDKNSVNPLYYQLKDTIRQKVRDGEYKVSDLIPSTAELCKIYKLSTTPVRRAISELIGEGLLKGMPGKGTFVVAEQNQVNQKGNRLVGVIFTGPTTHPFFMDILNGIETFLNPFGYHLIVTTSNSNAEKERQIVLELREKGAEGLILTPVITVNRTPSADQALKEVLAEDFPLVFVDSTIPEIQVDYVTTNNEKGGYLATRHLIKLGHSRIGFVLGININTVQERLAGYRRALNEFNIPYDPLLVKHSYLELQYEDAGYQNTMDLLHLANPPSAIFSCNDTLVLGVYRACWELGKRIPDDISVIGFDDVSYSAFLCPPLTTIHQPKVEMGQKAAELLLNLIRGGKNNPAQVILDNHLVERSSCATLSKIKVTTE